MAESPSGTIAGRYRVLGNLGKGAMGLVFMAYDPVLDRKVAIKQMTAEIADNQELRQRFYIEARAAARLNHPNIITIHELQEADGDIFMIMEMLEGKPLSAMIQAKPIPLSIEATLDVMAQVCDGLDYAHQRSIVHRDIKPANLFLAPSGVVKILDFGIARLGSLHMTQAGALLGTPDYMSPEQIRGDAIDRRTDLWAVGAVLYQLLAGVKPFEGKPLARLLGAIAQAPHVPLRERVPSVPKGVSDLVDRLLAKPRESRPASAGLVRDELRAILGRESAGTRATLAEDEYEATLLGLPPGFELPARRSTPEPATPVSGPPPAVPEVPPASTAALVEPPKAAADEGDRTVAIAVGPSKLPAAPRVPPPGATQTGTSSQPRSTTAIPALPPMPVVPPVPGSSAAPAPASPAKAVTTSKPPARPATATGMAAPAAPVSAMPPRSPVPAANPPAKKSATALVAAAVGAVVLLGAGGAAWWFLNRPSAPAASDAAAAQPRPQAPPAQPPSQPGAAETSSVPVATEPPAVAAAAGPAPETATPPARVISPPPQAAAARKQAASATTPPPAASAQTTTPQPTVAGTGPGTTGPPSTASPAARRSTEGGVETGVAGAAAARPGVSDDTLDAFKGRSSAQGDQGAADIAAANRITYVLSQYVQALVNGDAEAIREYRPSPSSEEALLLRAKQLKVRLEDVRVQVNGTEAVARCRRKIEGTAVTGARIEQDEPATFHLSRRPTGWVITEVR